MSQSNDDIRTRLAALQQLGGAPQQGAQQQPGQPQLVTGGAFANALQTLSRALQGGGQDPSQQYDPTGGLSAPASAPPAPRTQYSPDPAADFASALQQIGDYRNAQHQKQQQAAMPFFPAVDQAAVQKEQQRQTQKWEEDNAFRHSLSAWQRPPATPAVIQKLLAEGRITPVEAQMGQTPSFADGRMNGFVMP